MPFNLFKTIHCLPKKEEAKDLTAQLLGSVISEILRSKNESETKLFLIQDLLIKNGLYLESKSSTKK
jgi:hypothetical protein